MRRPDSSTSSFIDLLFNILLGFFMMLMLALTLINPTAKQKDVELKAEMIISMEWPNDSADDIDLMVRAPNGDIVFYGRRNIKMMSIDRDDRGQLNDRVRMEDGSTLVIRENWENVTIRRLLPGEYIVNVYAFTKPDKFSTPVTVKVQKINPRHSTVFLKTIDLTHVNEERTFVRFTVDGDGNVTNLDDTDYSFQEQIDLGVDVP
jgi:hypothetical protein